MDVGVAVESGDAGDDVGVCGGSVGCARAAVGVDDYVPLNLRVGGDGGEDVGPGGGAVTGVEV